MSAWSQNQRSQLKVQVPQTAERSSIVNYGHLLTWTTHPDTGEWCSRGRRLISIIQGRTITDRIPDERFPGHWESTWTPVPSTGTQHTLTQSRHLYTSENTHVPHRFNRTPPTLSVFHIHTHTHTVHTHANFTLCKCEACQPGLRCRHRWLERMGDGYCC